MASQASRCLLASLLLAGGLLAHGGQYRGPVAQPRMPLFGVPTGGAPPGPKTPAPTTGARDLAPSQFTWQTWWEFNKEPFLRSRVQGRKATLTGSDDFYLGARSANRLVDVLETTERDRVDRIVPALVKLLEAERNRDIQTACLIALGKVGLDAPGAKLEELLAERIERDDQEVRESAVLSLGIAGREVAFDRLVSLLIDDKHGRRMAKREHVRDRTRAFAAYGLGLLVRRVGDARLAQRAHDVLWPLLQDKDVKDRDLRTAIVTALGSLRADPTRSADKRLAWQTVDELLRWFGEDHGNTEEFVQAHAAVAIGRLLGRGTSPLHQRCKRAFLETLLAKKRRGAPILQSSAIALGMLAVSEEEEAADEPFSEALRSYYKDGRDQHARNFCVMGLGRIGGAANREWLGVTYARANKGTERPWLALALGLQAAPAALDGEPDAGMGDMLLQDLEDASTDDYRSALAVAVGLTGHAAAVPTLQRLLQQHEGDQRTAAYLCVALGLLHDASAVPQLSEVLQRSERRPFLLQQCAVALGCLGDRGANGQLLEMMKRADSVAVLAAMASAISRIGDRRSIDALIELSEDRGLTKLARAFVAAALGGVGDKDVLPWNVPLSVDSNYTTGIDTLSNGATGVLDIL